MTQNYANKVLAFIESDCKSKVEKAIKDTIGVTVDLHFKLEECRMYGYRISCYDMGNDMNEQMTATPLLKQLFSMAQLRVDVWADDEAPMAIFFNIGVSYIHNYKGGSNGHDLMSICMNDKGDMEIGK